MTTDDIVRIIETNPAVQQIQLDAAEKRQAIEKLVPVAVDELVIRYDWDFATDTADETIVADQSDYTLRGNNNDCRDIINIRYGTSTSLELLDKKRPVDADEFLSGRSVSGVGFWVPNGRSADGFPKISVHATPSTSGKILRYRYRRNDVTINRLPDNFLWVLLSGILKHLIPAYSAVYEHDLKVMIDRYEMPGGEDMPVQIDPVLVDRNNERAKLYGYS